MPSQCCLLLRWSLCQKPRHQDMGGYTTLKKKPLYFERGWNLLMIIFFSLVFSRKNCEEHEYLKVSTSFSLEILWTHSPGKYSYPVMTKSKHAIWIIMSLLVFGSDFCVFKQKCGFLGLQQCLCMYFFLPELDLTLLGRGRFLFHGFLQYQSHCQWPVNFSNDVHANNHWLSLIQIAWTLLIFSCIYGSSWKTLLTLTHYLCF